MDEIAMAGSDLDGAGSTPRAVGRLLWRINGLSFDLFFELFKRNGGFKIFNDFFRIPGDYGIQNGFDIQKHRRGGDVL